MLRNYAVERPGSSNMVLDTFINEFNKLMNLRGIKPGNYKKVMVGQPGSVNGG